MLIAVPVHADTPKPIVLTDGELSEIKSYVADGLKDPEAARFKHINAAGRVFPHKDTGLPTFSGVVCGWLNAKNSYGAYVGMMPFAVQVIGKPFGEPLRANDVRGANIVIGYCREFGVNLTN